MKNLFLILALTTIIFSCLDYKSSEIISPDGNYSLIIKVNRTNKSKEFYAEPIFEIYNSEKKLIDKIESEAGDFSQWKAGWSKTNNILLMNSSDIGIKAWEISENGAIEKELNEDLINQANQLK